VEVVAAPINPSDLLTLTGESVVALLRRFGSPILDDCKPMLYVDVQKMEEPAFPPGRLNYWKANSWRISST